MVIACSLLCCPVGQHLLGFALLDAHLLLYLNSPLEPGYCFSYHLADAAHVGILIT